MTSALGQPFGYTGREYDTESELYYYRARYFEPRWGRFISEDPIRFEGGMNFYAYAGNNPVTYTDPFGLKCTYSQGSGSMVCTDDKTGKSYYSAKGYAGTGVGRNNPAAQAKENVGPIPRGTWQLSGPWFNHKKLGKNVMVLVPLAGNECLLTGRDCSSFRIHGNNKQNDASEGCIILPPDRTTIKTGETLEVVK